MQSVAKMPPNPLNDCDKFSRLVAVSLAPSSVTYGLAAVSRNTKPHPIMKRQRGMLRNCPPSTRNKEQGAHTKEEETEDHATAITIPVDKKASRYCHQEITQIGGNLNNGGMSNTDVQSILEVLVEHIENGTREAPQKEERRNENERDKISPVACLICFCLLFC